MLGRRAGMAAAATLTVKVHDALQQNDFSSVAIILEQNELQVGTDRASSHQRTPPSPAYTQSVDPPAFPELQMLAHIYAGSL